MLVGRITHTELMVVAIQHLMCLGMVCIFPLTNGDVEDELPVLQV